jgi:hypothetical protein
MAAGLTRVCTVQGAGYTHNAVQGNHAQNAWLPRHILQAQKQTKSSPTVTGNPAHAHSERRTLHPMHCFSAGQSTHARCPRCIQNKSVQGRGYRECPCLRAVDAGLQESSAASKQGLHARSASRSAEHMTNGSSAPVDDTDRTPTWSARTDVLATTYSLNVAGVQRPVHLETGRSHSKPAMCKSSEGHVQGFLCRALCIEHKSNRPCCFCAIRERCQTTQTGGMRPRWP